jgi:hypothetical protein
MHPYYGKVIPREDRQMRLRRQMRGTVGDHASAILEEFTPLGFMEFCLDREIPQWVIPDFNKTILDLGPGTKFTIAKAIRLDYPEWDGEEQDCLRDFVDGEVGGIFAINILEHLSDPRFLIAEMARVLAPGCPATIFVPHALSGMYLQDLDHKTPFILDTFKNHLDSHPYYTKGRQPLGLRVGFNMKFGIKEENTGILTQLIKEGER